jgi:hypothetical protein
MNFLSSWACIGQNIFRSFEKVEFEELLCILPTRQKKTYHLYSLYKFIAM